MSAALIDEPPSEVKRELIEEFLRLNGTQERIDSGAFVHRLTMPPSPLFKLAEASMSSALKAVDQVYEAHRQAWQDEYERHANWEFTDDELRAINKFLQSEVGQHFLEGRRRMDAYVGTNTEPLMEEILKAAVAHLTSASGAGR